MSKTDEPQNKKNRFRPWWWHSDDSSAALGLQHKFECFSVTAKAI